jgi:hypothetical protein
MKLDYKKLIKYAAFKIVVDENCSTSDLLAHRRKQMLKEIATMKQNHSSFHQ